MSIRYGSIDRILFKYPNVDISKLKFVGWGAGQWFRDYYPHVNFPISYTVCPRHENHGTNINGIDVLPIETLLKEDPATTFILILAAASNEITNQIRALGDFMCAPCFQFGTKDFDVYEDLQSVFTNIDKPLPKLSYTGNIGFFTQGPISPHTEICLAFNCIKFPFDYHCLVTYTNQDQYLIDRCSKWVNDVILIDDLSNPGFLNRNRMIRSARFGAANILKKNVNYAVRVRSGCVVKGNVSKFIFDNYGMGDLNKGKIGFYMATGWKNSLFHISDALMIARSSDMLKLWSVPEDPRSNSDWEAHINDMNPPLSQSQFADFYKINNEPYLWSNYAKSIGFPTDTLDDYYSFMRANLIPLEPAVATFSLKHIPIFNLDYDNGFSPDLNWWRNLSLNYDAEYKRALARLQGGWSIDDFWKNKLG